MKTTRATPKVMGLLWDMRMAVHLDMDTVTHMAMVMVTIVRTARSAARATGTDTHTGMEVDMDIHMVNNLNMVMDIHMAHYPIDPTAGHLFHVKAVVETRLGNWVLNLLIGFLHMTQLNAVHRLISIKERVSSRTPPTSL
jgi:hypothetical protein